MDVTITIPDDFPQDKIILFNNHLSEIRNKIKFYEAIVPISFINQADYKTLSSGGYELTLEFINEPAIVQRCIENAVSNRLYSNMFSVFKSDTGYIMVTDGVNTLAKLGLLLNQD